MIDLITKEEIKVKVNFYFLDKPVDLVYLCGSYAKNIAHENSDIDLLLFTPNRSEFDIPFHLWQTDLTKSLNCPVELFIGSDKPYKGYKFAFYQRLYKEKILLYSKSENAEKV